LSGSHSTLPKIRVLPYILCKERGASLP